MVIVSINQVHFPERRETKVASVVIRINRRDTTTRARRKIRTIYQDSGRVVSCGSHVDSLCVRGITIHRRRTKGPSLIFFPLSSVFLFSKSLQYRSGSEIERDKIDRRTNLGVSCVKKKKIKGEPKKRKK